MKELVNQAEEFILQNPHYGYLIVAIILLIMSIGNFKRWAWAVSPSGSKQRWWYEVLGEKHFSTIMGIIFLIGAIAGFSGFLFTVLP